MYKVHNSKSANTIYKKAICKTILFQNLYFYMSKGLLIFII